MEIFPSSGIQTGNFIKPGNALATLKDINFKGSSLDFGTYMELKLYINPVWVMAFMASFKSDQTFYL